MDRRYSAEACATPASAAAISARCPRRSCSGPPRTSPRLRCNESFREYSPAPFPGSNGESDANKTLSAPKNSSPQAQRRQRAKRRGICVKHFEIFLRPLFQSPPNHRQIFLLGARAQLIESGPGASGKVGNHGAQVMRDDFQIGKAVKVSGKQNARHGHGSFIRPSKHPPQLEFRFLLRHVVGKADDLLG